jgi:hypothetical protein
MMAQGGIVFVFPEAVSMQLAVGCLFAAASFTVMLKTDPHIVPLLNRMLETSLFVQSILLFCTCADGPL